VTDAGQRSRACRTLAALAASGSSPVIAARCT
jgi:hypothetical protein